MIANLLIEYIGYTCFQKVINKVKPQYVSCVIQINEEDHFISDSPYIHVFNHLDKVHRQISEKTLVKAMKAIKYDRVLSEERPLPNGKKLLRLDFKR